LVFYREWSVISEGMNCIGDYLYIYGDGSSTRLPIYMYYKMEVEKNTNHKIKNMVNNSYVRQYDITQRLIKLNKLQHIIF
jgi:hypothetical protein